MNAKRRFSDAFKAATIVCCLTGVLSNLIRTTSIESILSFYTMQSNIFVLLVYLGIVIIKRFKPNLETTDLYYFLKGATVMVIMLTFIVYVISLQPASFAMDVKTSSSNIFRFSNIFVHFLTPIMVLLDYLLCDEKGHFKLRYPFLWYLFPAMYPIYVYTYSSMGGRFFGIGGSKKYAYFFLDIDKLGVFGVFKYIIFISLCFIFLCYVLILVDKLLSKRKEKKLSKQKNDSIWAVLFLYLLHCFFKQFNKIFFSYFTWISRHTCISHSFICKHI